MCVDLLKGFYAFDVCFRSGFFECRLRPLVEVAPVAAIAFTDELDCQSFLRNALTF